MTDHPNQELDTAITAAPSDDAGRVRVMKLVVGSVVVLPSATFAESLANVTPVMFPPAAHPSLTVFTTAEGAAMVANVAPYQLTITGFDLVMSIAPAMGLAVAGTHGVVVFDPGLLAAVRKDLLDRGDA